MTNVNVNKKEIFTIREILERENYMANRTSKFFWNAFICESYEILDENKEIIKELKKATLKTSFYTRDDIYFKVNAMFYDCKEDSNCEKYVELGRKILEKVYSENAPFLFMRKFNETETEAFINDLDLMSMIVRKPEDLEGLLENFENVFIAYDEEIARNSLKENFVDYLDIKILY